MQSAPNEKECRAPMVNHRSSASSVSSSSEAPHLPQPSTAKHRGRDSRKVERREHQRRPRRQGRDNFVAIIVAASLCRGVCGSTAQPHRPWRH
jgi:hypothetical protein